MKYLIICLSLVSARENSSKLTEYKFKKDPICDVHERINQGCSKEIIGVRGMFECLIKCGRDDSCIGASLDIEGKCFVHEECLSVTGCSSVDSNHESWYSYCRHGLWHSSTGLCRCQYGSFGDRCDQYIQTCKDLVSANYRTGSYWTLIDPLREGKTPMKVLCLISQSGKSNIQVVGNSGGISFNRTWNEYVNGFYQDKEHFWVGLKAWNILSKNGCSLTTFALHFKSGIIFRVYKNFTLSDGDQLYSYTFNGTHDSRVGEIPGPFSFGDCMSFTQNSPFSTWDMDQDGNGSENCASMAGAGWWYSACDSPCNLLGWGLDNWDATPELQRFSLKGLDTCATKSQISRFEIFLKC